MTSKEFETVAYPKLKHVRAFVNNILYRNYHLHGETEFLCVLGGECKVNKAGKSIEAKKGSVVLINPHESHEIVGASEGTDFIVIQLSRHILREYFPLMQTSFFSETDLNAAFGGETDKLWRQILVLTDSYIRAQSGFELRCVAAAAGILSLLYDNVPHTACSEVEYLDRKKAVARTERIASYIDENYRYGITLSDLAREENLTPTYLSHFFVDRFGITFREYVNNIRFENALRLMPNTKMSIVEIAMHSGFSDVKYLTKMFALRFGCTPRQFRAGNAFPAPDAHHEGPVAAQLEREYSHEKSLEMIRLFAQERGITL